MRFWDNFWKIRDIRKIRRSATLRNENGFRVIWISKFLLLLQKIYKNYKLSL